MAEDLMESPTRRFDKSIACRQKSLDYNNFVEELLSAVSTCIKYQETNAAQLYEKTTKCERLKKCLENLQDELAKSCIHFEDRTKHYQILLNNNDAKEFLDFANFLKTRSESSENTMLPMLKSENVVLKRKLEALDLHNLTLNSNLKLVHESLNEEKIQRKRIENERKSLDYLSEKLCSLLLNYQRQICQIDEIEEATTRASCDDSNSYMGEYDSDVVLRMDTSSESNPDENNSFHEGDKFLILHPPNFRDDSTSPRNIDPNELLLKEKEKFPNGCEKTFNLSLAHNLGMQNSIQGLPSFANILISPTTPAQLHSQSNISDAGIDQSHYSVQKLRDVNLPENHTESAMLKIKTPDVKKIAVLDSSGLKILPELVQTNENPSSLTVSSGCIRALTSPTVELLSSTRISVTPEQSHFECDTCGRIFSTKIDIVMHDRVHMKSIQSFHCEKCKESFPTKNCDHEMKKWPICDQNDDSNGDKNKRTITIEALETESEEQGQIGDYSKKCQKKVSNICCIICNKHYSSKFSLDRHIRMVHNGEKPYKCVKCDKRFGHKLSLERHTLVHGSQKPFKCSVCKVGFKDPRDKRRHERIVHEGGARLQCAHCNQRFGRKQELISHIHTKHFSGFQKQFKCTICDKSFALKKQLQQHKFTHTSKRSFKCSVCDCTFKYLADKIHHEKTVHGKGAHFRCKHCDKVYKHKAFLIRHLRKDHVKSDEDNESNGL